MYFNNFILIANGLIIAAYWARVVRMAAKSRRRSGSSANFLPPEPLGRLLRLIWIPAIGLWIASPFLAAFCKEAIARPLATNLVLQITGLAISLAAFLLTLACWRFMGRAWRMGINPKEKNPLVVAGPFAWARHPIYALSSAMMLGSVICVFSILILIAAAIHLSLLQWEARREERHMLGIYGEQYANYSRTTNRFFPRLKVLFQRRSTGPCQ